MFSIPPTTTISLSPLIMVCAPIIIDFIPEEHTLLIVVHGVFSDKPASIAACQLALDLN